MAVVSTNGNGFKNLVASFAQVGAIMAEATVKALVSQVAVGNGDDIGSIYHLGWIKSNAIIEPTSVAIVQAIAGLTNVKVGISGSGGQAVAAGVNNCLVNGVNWSAGGSFSLTGAITAPTHRNGPGSSPACRPTRAAISRSTPRSARRPAPPASSPRSCAGTRAPDLPRVKPGRPTGPPQTLEGTMPTQIANTEPASPTWRWSTISARRRLARSTTMSTRRARSRRCSAPHAMPPCGANDWNFATAWVIPSLLAKPSNNSSFPNRFALPDDCLRVRFVCARSDDPTPLPFEDWNIEAPNVNPGDVADARMVLVMRARQTVIPPATTPTTLPPMVCYTRRIDNPDLWDSEFVDAFAEQLAGLAAPAILKDPTEAKQFREGRAAKPRSRRHGQCPRGRAAARQPGNLVGDGARARHRPHPRRRALLTCRSRRWLNG
jgi:hypothetical protein